MLAAAFFVHGAERNMAAKAALPRHGEYGKNLPYLIFHFLAFVTPNMTNVIIKEKKQ